MEEAFYRAVRNGTAVHIAGDASAGAFDKINLGIDMDAADGSRFAVSHNDALVAISAVIGIAVDIEICDGSPVGVSEQTCRSSA